MSYTTKNGYIVIDYEQFRVLAKAGPNRRGVNPQVDVYVFVREIIEDQLNPFSSIHYHFFFPDLQTGSRSVTISGHTLPGWMQVAIANIVMQAIDSM
jgi:hypothetical protein